RAFGCPLRKRNHGLAKSVTCMREPKEEIMKSLSHRFAILLTIALCGGLVLCDNAYAAQFDPSTHMITVITPSHSNSFFKTEADTAVAMAQKLGYKTNSVSHGGDPAVQLKMIE